MNCQNTYIHIILTACIIKMEEIKQKNLASSKAVVLFFQKLIRLLSLFYFCIFNNSYEELKFNLYVFAFSKTILLLQ